MKIAGIVLVCLNATFCIFNSFVGNYWTAALNGVVALAALAVIQLEDV